jgi:hypothetical protein
MHFIPQLKILNTLTVNDDKLTLLNLTNEHTAYDKLVHWRLSNNRRIDTDFKCFLTRLRELDKSIAEVIFFADTGSSQCHQQLRATSDQLPQHNSQHCNLNDLGKKDYQTKGTEILHLRTKHVRSIAPPFTGQGRSFTRSR